MSPKGNLKMKISLVQSSVKLITTNRAKIKEKKRRKSVPGEKNVDIYAVSWGSQDCQMNKSDYNLSEEVKMKLTATQRLVSTL